MRNVRRERWTQCGINIEHEIVPCKYMVEPAGQMTEAVLYSMCYKARSDFRAMAYAISIKLDIGMVRSSDDESVDDGE